jgi:hypothetical protein
VVIDDKGGEVVHIDRFVIGKGSIKIFLKHTSMGRKLINLYVAFKCDLHMYACMA